MWNNPPFRVAGMGAMESSTKHKQPNQGCVHRGVFGWRAALAPLAPLSVLGWESWWFFSSNRSGLYAW